MLKQYFTFVPFTIFFLYFDIACIQITCLNHIFYTFLAQVIGIYWYALLQTLNSNFLNTLNYVLNFILNLSTLFISHLNFLKSLILKKLDTFKKIMFSFSFKGSHISFWKIVLWQPKLTFYKISFLLLYLYLGKTWMACWNSNFLI